MKSETVDRQISIKRSRTMLQPLFCVHSNTVEVKQLEGTFFGNLYIARCLSCGVSGPLQTTPEEALEELKATYQVSWDPAPMMVGTNSPGKSVPTLKLLGNCPS